MDIIYTAILLYYDEYFYLFFQLKTTKQIQIQIPR